MRLALSKTAIESQIASRFGDVFKLNNREAVEVLSTGITELDALNGGLPRGAITELFGPASSGRTSLMLATLAHATAQMEVCALVDMNAALDPASAANAGIDLDRLLWIRCAGNLEHAFKATDLLLQGGGFGLVLLDLADVPAKQARRVISSWWYRFRRTLENTPTALVVIAQESCVRSCAYLALELKREASLWSSASEKRTASEWEFSTGKTQSLVHFSQPLSSASSCSAGGLYRNQSSISPTHSHLLRGMNFQAECQRPLYVKRQETQVLVKLPSLNRA